MPRRSRRRLLYDGCLAHVFSRSIETRYIFRDEEELSEFRDLLLQSKHKHGFKVHHYCLMNTHFHLAVTMPEVEAFADGMKWVKRQYTQWYNVRHERRGTLWQERYKSLLIENESYLRACGEYIENNPVEASMVKQASDWAFSSSRYYELGADDELVDGYEQCETRPAIKEKPEFFEKGDGIGSELFKLVLRDELAPVP